MFKKILKYSLIVLGTLLLLIFLYFRFVLDFSMSDKKARAFFKDQPFQPEFAFLDEASQSLHYLEVGKDSLALLVFVHGSPGSWDAWKEYLVDSALLSHYRMIALDRPGYGSSATQTPTLAAQSALISRLIDKRSPEKPITLVGHSYGGPVCVRLAMDHPDQVSEMILLAGVYDPELEKRYLIQKPLASPALSWLLSPTWNASNREMLPLKAQLIEMLPLWDRITAKSLVVQGDADMIVDPGNAAFAMERLPEDSRLIWLEKENHFLPWTRFELIREELLTFADTTYDSR